MPETPRRPRPSATLPPDTAELIRTTATSAPVAVSIALRVIVLPPPSRRR